VGGLAFVGSASGTDLIVNGSFEDVPSAGSDFGPNGWNGVCRGYNYSLPYFTGPPIPASENPGAIYSWRHRRDSSDDAYATPMTQTVNLLTGATAANIDAGHVQYTFSVWLASYGQPGSNPDQPYVTLSFVDATSFVETPVIFDRATDANFTVFADGVSVFDTTTHLHAWAKYATTNLIPAGARFAVVGIQHSPTVPLSGGPDTYVDLVKLDVISGTPQTLDFPELPEKTFNDSPFMLQGVASSGLTVHYTSSDLTVATIENNSINIVGAGSSVITASQAGDQTYLPSANVSRTLVVHRATAAINLSNLSVQYDGSSKSPSVATIPPLIPFTITFNGSSA